MPQVREVDSSATWRGQPLSYSECILRISRNRGYVCPLLTAPWVTNHIFRMDWLHISDLGIAADFLGNFFHVVTPLFPGTHKKDKCTACYNEMQAFYEEGDVQDRCDSLPPTFFEPKDAAYKLRGSAAKIRALVPFADQLAR